MSAQPLHTVGLGPGEPCGHGLSLTQHFVPVGGKKLSVCSWGNPSAPCIVLLHGLQSHAGLWEKTAADLAGRGYYVVAPDRRGHGHSDWYSSYYIWDYVNDIGELLQQLTSEPVTLVAHCESTLLASFFASAFPESVAKLVLIQFPDLSRKMPLETQADLMGLFLQKRAGQGHKPHPKFANHQQATECLLRDAPFKIPPQMAHRVTPRNTRQVDQGYTWRWDPAIMRYRLLYDLLDIDLLAASMKNAAKNAAKKTEMAIELVYGERSSLMGPRRQKLLDFSAAIFPSARQHLVAGGHYPHMEEELCPAFLATLM